MKRGKRGFSSVHDLLNALKLPALMPLTQPSLRESKSVLREEKPARKRNYRVGSCVSPVSPRVTPFAPLQLKNEVAF
jgi:hypothetical protein